MSTTDSMNLPGAQDEYLISIKNSVTRQFCIFSFILSAIAVPPSFLARERYNFLINFSAFFLYSIPFLIVVFSTRYRFAAKLQIAMAMVITVINAINLNQDISPTTIVWYFVYLVFAHLVLDFYWALFVAGVGAVSVTVFSCTHFNQIINFPFSQFPRSVFIGSSMAMVVSLCALLYLLSVYKKIRNVIIGRVLKANRESSRLLGVLSHDMRNYLGAVDNIHELILDELESADHKQIIEYTRLLGDASSRALLLLEDVVGAFKDMAESEIFLEKTDVWDFLFPLLERYKVMARQKGVMVEGNGVAGKLYANINREKLSRAVENLLSNAVKFCNKGDTVSVKVHHEKDWVIIEVSDTGIGIPDELKERIFEPFSGTGRVGTAQEKTYGLGMSIVKKLVELHNGMVRLESEVGKGTSVYIHVQPSADAGNE